MSNDESINYKKQSRGTEDIRKHTEEYITRIYPFDKYEIVVKLTLDGRFIGIEGIRINKDFRSYEQRASQKVFSYIDDYEPE